jgi:hypothetical protein
MNLPTYPEFKTVGIEDCDVITRYLDAHPSAVCEMNFPNILIWKNSERPRYTVIEGNLCLLVEPTFEPAYFFPPLGRNAMDKTLAACLAHAPRLSRVPEDFVRAYGAGFRVEEDRNNFDYIYRTEDLIELVGKKYDGKRNRIKKFESSFPHEYECLEARHIEACRSLFLQWFGEKECPGPYLEAERDAILEALKCLKPLGFAGGVVTVNGRVEAFTVGTRLTGDTAVVQIEIANPAYPGLAQWINREFVRREWRAFRYVNREQDVGVPGLRRAKLSYHPDHLLAKYNLYPR